MISGVLARMWYFGSLHARISYGMVVTGHKQGRFGRVRIVCEIHMGDPVGR